jgi:hypothetical protein
MLLHKEALDEKVGEVVNTINNVQLVLLQTAQVW